MRHFRLIAATLATALFAGSAQAEVQKFMNTCDASCVHTTSLC